MKRYPHEDWVECLTPLHNHFTTLSHGYTRGKGSAKDKTLLEIIQKSLGVGKIRKHSEKSLWFEVNSKNDLRVIFLHFDKYYFLTKKFADYQLFKQAIALMQRKEHLTLEGLRKIVAIKASMNKGLSEELKLAFPGVVPVTRSDVEVQKKMDPF